MVYVFSSGGGGGGGCEDGSHFDAYFIIRLSFSHSRSNWSPSGKWKFSNVWPYFTECIIYASHTQVYNLFSKQKIFKTIWCYIKGSWRVRSRNNSMFCMSFYILMKKTTISNQQCWLDCELKHAIYESESPTYTPYHRMLASFAHRGSAQWQYTCAIDFGSIYIELVGWIRELSVGGGWLDDLIKRQTEIYTHIWLDVSLSAPFNSHVSPC